MTQNRVENLLSQMKTDITVVEELYRALSKENYLVMVSPTTFALGEDAQILITPGSDDRGKALIFTSAESPTINHFINKYGCKLLEVEGLTLFKYLKDNVVHEGGEVDVLLNPGMNDASIDGINITRSILLTIIAIA